MSHNFQQYDAHTLKMRLFHRDEQMVGCTVMVAGQWRRYTVPTRSSSSGS